MKRPVCVVLFIFLIAFFITLAQVHAQVTVFTDETAYMNALASGGYGTFQEGFEDSAVWGAVRFPDAASSVTGLGLVWTTNHPDAVTLPSRITTNSGASLNGMWGIFSSPHGDPDRETSVSTCDVTPVPLTCYMYDGFIAARVPGTGALYGAGVWIGGTFGGKIIFILDGDETNPADFGDAGMLTGTGYQFFGVIDTGGFTSFEVRETEGTTGDEKLIFADDFIFGTDAAVCTSDTECDDGLFCNGSETCNLTTGQCEPSIPVNCDDGTGCTDDSCDETNDTCVSTANNANCPDDGAFCNGTEICDAVNDCTSTGDPCTAGTACNEGTDTCDAIVTGCTSDTECDDGLFCNGAETCNLTTNQCEPASPGDCVDLPDLNVASVSFNKREVSAGRRIIVSSKTANPGTGSAAASKTRYYLSVNKTKDSKDKRLSGYSRVPALNPGESTSVRRKVVIPSNTRPGRYYVIACADYGNTVAETNESNNCTPSGRRMSVTR